MLQGYHGNNPMRLVHLHLTGGEMAARQQAAQGHRASKWQAYAPGIWLQSQCSYHPPLLQGHAITLLQLLLNTLAPNVVSLGMMPGGGSGDAENLLMNHTGSTSEAVMAEWVWALRPTPRPCHSPTLSSRNGRLNRSCCSQGPNRSPSVYP